jgi:hypothetical protein
MSEVRQFKMITGQEIICEVMEWPDDQVADMIVKNAVEVVGTDMADGIRYYSFKPWMVMQEGDGVFLNLNADMIVCEAIPTAKLFSYYEEAIANKKKELEEDEVPMSSKIEEWLNRLRDQVEGATDSDGKVIRFPNKDKLH